MPKKTKKEKLLAQKHRTNLSPVVIQHTFERTVVSPPVDTRVLFTLPNRNNTAAAPQAAAIYEYRLMKRDLVKTLLLTSVILMGEFLLAGSLPR